MIRRIWVKSIDRRCLLPHPSRANPPSLRNTLIEKWMKQIETLTLKQVYSKSKKLMELVFRCQNVKEGKSINTRVKSIMRTTLLLGTLSTHKINLRWCLHKPRPRWTRGAEKSSQLRTTITKRLFWGLQRGIYI